MSKVRFHDIIKKHGADILDSDGMKIEKNCIQHGTFSVYDHSLYVTSMCLRISKKLKLKVDEKALVRGALLHDYFLYDWHEPTKANRIHGFTHPGIALNNAEKVFHLGKIEKNMIKTEIFYKDKIMDIGKTRAYFDNEELKYERENLNKKRHDI